MLKAAICDDDALELERITGYVRAYSDYDIHAYTDSRKLAQDIQSGAAFDLYLLDVVMPQPDGIELAQLVRETDQQAVIIYITNYDERALEAFRVRAAQYLSKPVTLETLSAELDAAITATREKSRRTFMHKTAQGIEAIPYHKIMYLELNGRRLTCVASDGKRHTSVTMRQSFSETVAPLLADERFVSPHASYVVNMDFVSSMSGKDFIMRNGAAVPISQSMRSKTRVRYMRYFLG